MFSPIQHLRPEAQSAQTEPRLPTSQLFLGLLLQCYRGCGSPPPDRFPASFGGLLGSSLLGSVPSPPVPGVTGSGPLSPARCTKDPRNAPSVSFARSAKACCCSSGANAISAKARDRKMVANGRPETPIF